MWQLLKAELEYHKRIFFGFFVLALTLGGYATNPFVEDLSANFVLFLMMFLFLQNWNTLRNKERRDLQRVRLPLPIRRIALERITMIFVAFALLVGGYFLIQFLFVRSVDYIRALIAFGIILMGFSIYYLMRDLLLPLARRIGLTQTRVMWGLAICGIGFNLLGIFFFIRTSASGTPPVSLDFIIRFIRFIKNANVYDLSKFFGPGITLACLTVISFSKRRSFFE